MFKNVLAALSLGALVSAVGLDSLTKTCRDAVVTLSAQPDVSQCIAANQLLNILLVPADDSTVNAARIFLNAFCGSAPECSPNTISDVAFEIAEACAADLGQFGVGPEHVATVVPYIVENWAVGKEVICLADSLANQFCIPSIMSSIESALGVEFSSNWLTEHVVETIKNKAFGLPAEVACVPCTQAAFLKVTTETDIDQLFDLTSFATDNCGANFTTSSELPANILIGTGDDAPIDGPPVDGAARLSVAGSLLAVVAVVAMQLL